MSYNRRFEFKLAKPVPKNNPNTIPEHVLFSLSEKFSELVNDSLSDQELLDRLYECQHWTTWVIKQYEGRIALDTPIDTEDFDD